MLTCSVLAKNMIMPDVTNKVYFDFHSDPTTENVLKLLIRGQKLYEVRVEISKILKQVIEIEQVVKPG